jgi:hypothetical protein
LHERLDESERLRLKAEAQLQQALTALGSGGHVPGRGPAPPRRSAPKEPATNDRPTVAGPRTEPAKIPSAKPQPANTPPPKPVTTPQPAAKASPPPAKRRRADKRAKPEPDRVTVQEEEVSVSATNGEGVDRTSASAPDPGPVEVPVGAATGPDADHEARDLLERLVPEASDPAPADDIGDLRSRLARTAALKKPGSRERQDARDEPS